MGTGSISGRRRAGGGGGSHGMKEPVLNITLLLTVSLAALENMAESTKPPPTEEQTLT